MNKTPYIKEADNVAFYYIYLLAMNDSIDLRSTTQKMDRQNQLYKFAKNKFDCKNDKLIGWCIDRYGYKKWSLQQLADEFKLRELWKINHYITQSITCCSSCHTGCSSTPYIEIEEQREKYGEFICKRCEENSLIAGKTQDLKDSLHRKLLLADDGFYYDEGVRPKGTQWLGFAGRWYLLKTKDRIWVTNNLFISSGLHKKLLKNFEHNINCEIYGVYYWQDIKKHLTDEEFEKLKETTGYKLFIDKYNYEWMDKHYNERT